MPVVPLLLALGIFDGLCACLLSPFCTLQAFWMPGQHEDAEAHITKPEIDTVCPATGKKLRMKDLVQVRWGESGGESECGRVRGKGSG